MREEPSVTIRLEGGIRAYQPGETLVCEYLFEDLPEIEGKSLEVSVAWFSEGKGDEDMAVHEFWRTDLEEVGAVDLRRPQCFSTVLPKSPLSYDGRIVKIRWCVRVRVFLRGGKEIFGQKIFRLGDVPAISQLTEADAVE
jgi:hypothetical protein